jgi:cobalt-precorrin-5B (C1)-methyltransferase
MSKKLRSGYTTGTHATSVVVALVYEYLVKKSSKTLDILLPNDSVAKIEVEKISSCIYSTIKVDNDDLDVTKGAKIIAQIMSKEPHGLKQQQPSLVEVSGVKLFLWAGDGVGVVTKEGLKIAPTYPAINPIPLMMMHKNLQSIVGKSVATLHIVLEVEDGEEIAKNTANAKVGVIGGISILGTRGIVKPVSATAYIDSIATEISVASKNSKTVVFTLGNSAQDKALELYDAVSVVEIGNFVYDAMMLLEGYHFKKIVFITSVAKMTKVAQGYKNTHNRFGSIDFTQVNDMLLTFGYEMQDDVVTLKAILDRLESEVKSAFIQKITKEAKMQLVRWLDEKERVSERLEVITLPSEIKEEYIW